MPTPSTQAFLDALAALERDGDVEALAGLYAEDATSDNLTGMTPFQGPDGARRFWSEDRGLFERVSSEFRSIVEADTTVALEWTRSGTGRSGDAIDYDGVSILTFDDAGRITRFRAYYDPSRLGSQAV